MKIYFTAAVYLQNIYGKNYSEIVRLLESFGHKVIHSHITNSNINEIMSTNDEHRKVFYKKIQRWLSDADVIVAEVSFPSSLNVGHEISIALEKGKPVIGLYLTGKSSPLLDGMKSDKFIYEKYTTTNLEQVVKDSMEYVQENADTRFNFIVPHKILEYLDWVAQHKNLPRSVYLRGLIEQDMRKNKDYGKE